MTFDAAVFDMDGVLIDGEDMMARCGADTLRAYGVPAVPEDFRYFRGRGDTAYMRGVAEKYGLSYTVRMKETAYRLYAERGAEATVFPGGKELLAALRKKGVKIAVATAADRTKLLINLKFLGLSEADFDAIVCGDEGHPPKPAPDLFLCAMERCGVPPCRAVVVEDAVSGVEAGKAAGAFVAAVATSFPEEKLKAAGADRVYPTVRELAALFD